jgi:hypothetical protein
VGYGNRDRWRLDDRTIRSNGRNMVTVVQRLRPLPMYATYLSFDRVMDQFHQRGLPPVVEAGMIDSVQPNTARRLIAGFRAASWIDDTGAPSAELRTMVKARGTAEWQEALGTALRHAYSFLPTDWEKLTSTQLSEAFQKHTGRNDGALKGAETFFLAAALDAGIPLAAELTLRASRSREDMSIRFRQGSGSPVGPAKQQGAQSTARTNGAEPHADADVAQVWDLLALIDEAEMTDKEKSAALTFFAYLRRRADRKRGSRA